MKTYKPYRHQLRRSLFASTIFPVFMVMIIGLISFYAIYMGRTSHHSSAYLSNSNRITTYRQTFSYVCYAATKQWRHVDLSHQLISQR